MKEREAEAPRVAASSYLNTAPLIWSFIRGRMQGDVRLLTDTAPARCAEMLARGEVEAALVPVIEYQRLQGIVVVPEVCIGATSRVRSVVLVTRGAELKDVRSVALDTSSRTSAALVQIIFREFLHVQPECRPVAPDLDRMLEESDAALIIGDPAMIFPRDGLRVYDLASLWREHTGLGFVFAMWMAREAASEKVLAIDFKGARDEGLARVDEIVAHYEATLGLRSDELRAYLLENISFELNAEMRAGLNLFYTLAHEHGIISEVRPLKMLGAWGG
ncbi:MAG: menaquinone biosynthesis protein [Acidobacteria bacterium]|nr:menaquinone biosynthesis protein [Acidobacteriota bacterium]